MGSSSGSSTSNIAVPPQVQVMDQRKRKRMLSNRESARRSRQRKQKHLDELAAQVSQLRSENERILAALHITSQHYAAVEADNSVLTTQVAELTNRLQSLDEILSYINLVGGGDDDDDSGMMRSWSFVAQQQPIMAASVDMFHYC